jgi:hypothetical protein
MELAVAACPDGTVYSEYLVPPPSSFVDVSTLLSAY